MYLKALYVVFALVVTNFLRQAAGERDWRTAFERSFFQAAAIVIYLIVLS